MTPENTLTAPLLESDEEVCPICLLPASETLKFCSGPCLHRLCVQDAERILLTKSRLPLQGETLDPYLFVPTIGRCPICRQGMSLFEMQLENGRLLCDKNTDVGQWAVAGKTFVEKGRLSISFDPKEGPRLIWHTAQDSGEEPERAHFFQPGCHFHYQSRTFYGQVDYPDDKNKLICIFQFSSDQRFVALGVMMDAMLQVVHFFGAGGRILSSSDLSTPRERPSYHRNSLWGNTFCQCFKVGVASYHFLTDEVAYISYEHSITSQWPPLDDGSPIPSRVYFRSIFWDDNDRIFRGEICWKEDFGTSWQGCRKWIYEMQFDSKFTFIASGVVRSIMVDHDNVLEMSNFGDDLVYMNAAVDIFFQSLVDRVSGQEEIPDQFARLSLPLRFDWTSEGASGRVLAMLHKAFTQFVIQRESPIDFNLA